LNLTYAQNRFNQAVEDQIASAVMVEYPRMT